MNRAGLRPLGWTIRERRPGADREELPGPDRLKDPAFAQCYRPIAEALRQVLEVRPAGTNPGSGAHHPTAV
ncbi:hypothetical protein ACWD4V_30915 [Streptomyces tsukubensis]